MQIVSEAQLDSIPAPILQQAFTHNRIAFITETILVVKSLGTAILTDSLPICGTDVMALSLEHQQFLTLIYRDGTFELRKVDKVSEVVRRIEGLLVNNDSKIRVTNEFVYLFGGEEVYRIDLATSAPPEKL